MPILEFHPALTIIPVYTLANTIIVIFADKHANLKTKYDVPSPVMFSPLLIMAKAFAYTTSETPRPLGLIGIAAAKFDKSTDKATSKNEKVELMTPSI